jgi:hypothetical protein
MAETPTFAQGWLKLADAPLGVVGSVWSPDMPDRNDLQGSVYEYSDGGRGVSSVNRGSTFTHWHALPAPPAIKEET